MGQPLVPHSGYRQDNINLFNIKRTQGKNQLPLVMLDRLAECLKNLRDDDKRQELDNLREYISKRIAMTDYP